MLTRDQRTLVIAGIIGLLVGGLAGVGGGVLVTTGRIGSFSEILRVRGGSGDVVEERRTVRIEEESATIDAVRRASPSVVSVVVRKSVNAARRVTPFDGFFEFGVPFPGLPMPQRRGEEGKRVQVGGGSGFLVTSDGYMLTNRHVVQDEDAEYAVVLNDDREFPASVVAKDPLNDLAVLKVNASGQVFPVLELGNSDDVQIGETVIAIGYALSEFRNSVTKGVVSGINRRITAGDRVGGSEVIDGAIQTDAAINPGNSGGPLLNLRGQVVGVNTAVSQEGQLLGFAIPVNIAKQAVESVIREGRIVRPWLGVRYLVITDGLAEQEDLPVRDGALVVRGTRSSEPAVVPNSPADRAGIKADDIITRVDGDAITDTQTLARIIATHRPGDRLRLTILRDGKERTIEVTLGTFTEE